MSTPLYFKPRAQDYLLRKAKADLEFAGKAYERAQEMLRRDFVDTPKDVSVNVSTFCDVTRDLRGALTEWVQALESAGTKLKPKGENYG